MTKSFENRLSFDSGSSVVLIGTSSYPKDEILDDLPHVIENIKTLVGLFVDPAVIGLSPNSIMEIVDEAHASVILTKLRERAKATEDTLLVYYSGHGLYGDVDSALYLASTNTTDEGKAYDGIAIEKLKKAILESPAKKKILILDCCYSGTVHEGGMDGDPMSPVLNLSGTYTIAASSSNVKALALPGEKYTVFTGELIRVLEEGLESLPSMLTIKKIFEAVTRSLQRIGNVPIPESSNWRGGDKFLFAINQFGKEKSSYPVLSALKDMEKRMQEQEIRLNKTMTALEASVSKKIDTLSNELSRVNQEVTPHKYLVIAYRIRKLIWPVLVLLVLVFLALNYGLG